MSSKAKKQSWALHISHFHIDQVPNPPGNWPFWPTSHPFITAQHNPVRAFLCEAAARQRTESRNFSSTPWAEIYKNLNQHHRIYAERFMQHSPLCYLPGLLEWMANMVENTLLSWCFAFCKRSSFVSPTLVLNWTPSTKASVGKVTTCSAIALKKMLLCYFIYDRKFLIFTQ